MANVKEKNVENLNKQEAFLLKYKKAIIIAVVALIVIVAGIILYNNYVAGPRQAKASTALAKGQEYFANENYEMALKGDSVGFIGFAKLAKEYSSTDAGNLANLYAGLCQANLGKWEEAVKFLDAYSPGDDTMVSPAAIAALGNAYAHVKQLDKAVANLKKAAKMADAQGADGVNNSLSPTFLIQAAEILESQNKKAEALSIYKDIKKKYVNSPVMQEIDKYIERVTE
ncbi:MAG: tetratricopeptide repeat protein [Prevotella sp.]|nr:tetratricopeptide repeat protein [Prevotella sp.]MBQ6309594.1 tetratricopeptide repeat protein [Prevotella sp.]MBQ6658068.1 tetratricopeptide repeat protein [Prevotella sp.]MBQ9571678.1 tetratricopeptide repeat protein [Prevotella sp.]MBR0525002.1 tetratricopeptide repeat protein [Prevotella sp.]